VLHPLTSAPGTPRQEEAGSSWRPAAERDTARRTTLSEACTLVKRIGTRLTFRS